MGELPWPWRRKKPSQEATLRILVFGDSNSARNRPGRAPCWPDILAQRIRDRAVVINVSCDGRTTGWDQGPLNAQACLGPTLERHTPLRAIIIALGTNDFKEKYRVAGAQAVLYQLERLIEIVQSKGVEPSHLILASPPPMGVSAGGELRGAAQKVARLAQLIRGYCAGHAMPLLDLQAGLSVRHHFGDDHIHLNSRGRKRTAKLASAVLTPLL